MAMLTGLLAASCSNDNGIQPQPEQTGNRVTFTVQTPGSEKVIYTSRAIHEADEYAINSLALYEYEIDGDGKATLMRIMKKDGNGNNALNLVANADNGYTFSIIVPAENDGKKYSYKFVANDPVEDPVLGSSFDVFKLAKASVVLPDEEPTADCLAAEEAGIAMSGVATDADGSELITMGKDVKCKVALQRIVSRIDISYQTPNLKVTNVYLTGAPTTGTLFPADDNAVPAVAGLTCMQLGLNTNVALPEAFLMDTEDTAVDLKKAFYVYERENSADDCMTVHIDYQVKANGSEDYQGSVDVPFCKKNEAGEDVYVNALRNNLYRIVLGNGTDPVSGKVKVRLMVYEWNGIDINEPLTDDDEVIN